MSIDPKHFVAAFAMRNPDIKVYHEALGKFISSFAEVEQHVIQALWKCSGIAPEIAPAVFSGVRIDTAASFLKRIAEVQDWPISRTVPLQRLLSQLAVITAVRNSLLHYGAQRITAGEWRSINTTAAHIPAKLKETRITASILDEMVTDLMGIRMHLAYVVFGDEWPDDDVKHSFERALKLAWRYKPAGQPRPPKTLQKRSPKQSRPPTP